MYSSLDKMDVVVKGPPGGPKRIAFQTDHRPAEEYEQDRALSTLFALARVINPQRAPEEGGGSHGVVYAASAHPPDWFRRAVAAAGAVLEIDRKQIAWEGEVADPADLADAAFEQLAQRVRAGRALDVDLLKHLEDETFADPPSPEEDEIRYWTRVIELAAVGGELIRTRLGGRWVRDDEWRSTVPFIFRQAGADTLFNVAGKAERCIGRGDTQRVSHLLLVIEDSQGGGRKKGFLARLFGRS